MKYDIKITPIAKSNVDKIDFNNIPFGKIFTDHMFIVDYINGEWQQPEIRPLEELPTHPGNLAWHYGQAIFEGMKATISKDGTPLLFRPEKHIERLNASAERMCMATLPEELFIEAIHKFVWMERNWIPPQQGSALYLRPMMYATDNTIGVRPSDTYRFVILALPVGPYYAQPVKLKAAEKYVRAIKGGVGEAKTAGNYAASLLPAKIAKEEVCDQVMWLDGMHFKYIQEVGTMNIFFVIDGQIITPALGGAILKGITRDSIIQLLKHKGYTVVEKDLTIDEVYEASKNGSLTEVFGSGTAAVIAPVAMIKWQDKIMELNPGAYQIAPMIKDTINGMRDLSIADEFGWIVPVNG